MAGLIQSNGTGGGLWSAGATWNGGVVPAAGDWVQILLGDTVTYDVLFAAAPILGGTPSIDIFGTLTVDRTAGMAYGVKCNRIYIRSTGVFDCSGDGADAPYPATSSFTVELQATAESITGVSPYTGKLNFVCAEPTYKYVSLSANEAAGQTVLSIDTDLTSDALWNTGAANIAIIGIRETGYTTASQEIRVCSATATGPNELTITAGLTAAKAAGSLIAVMDRNIVVTGKAGVTPTYLVRTMNNISGTLYNCKARLTGASYCILQLGGYDIGGCLDTASYGYSGIYGDTLSGLICNLSTAYALLSTYACKFTSGYVGFSSAFNSGQGIVVDSGAVFGPNLNYTFLYCQDIYADGIFYAVNSTLFYMTGRTTIGPNADIRGTNYLENSQTADYRYMDGASVVIYASTSDSSLSRGISYDVTPATGTDAGRPSVSWFPSGSMYAVGGEWINYNYLGVSGDYRESVFGGYVVGEGVVVPAGYSKSYKTTFQTDVTFGAYQNGLRWQRIHELFPGETLRYRTWVRKTSVVTADLPYLCLANRLSDPDFHDPLSLGYLDSATMTDSVDTWEQLEVSYTNTGDYPEEVWARLVVPYTSGMNLYFVPERLTFTEHWG